jgi:hypothetical protein
MDHPLENLGPERFQQLCQALLVQEQPGVLCFPVGQPDGGRDAIRMQPSTPSQRVMVFQVKYARQVGDAGDARDWVLKAAQGEVDKVKRLIERGAKAYHFITNVAGTSHLDTGSIDRLQLELQLLFSIPVTCWWRDDINRHLDGSWDIKLRYPEILNGQDFLRLLLETSSGQAKERQNRAIVVFLADQYNIDEDVKFKQVDLYNKLLTLFVDLPFTVEIEQKAWQAVSAQPH